MNTQATGQIRPTPSPESLTAHREAHQAVVSMFAELSHTFELFFTGSRINPNDITSADCLSVMMDAEELLRRVRYFQTLTRELQP